MKDLIANELAVGDKVQVHLQAANIVGFISAVNETSVLRVNKNQTPGHIIVTCSVAIPVEPGTEVIPQVVKVYDAARDAQNQADKAMAAVSATGRSN